MDKYLGLDKEIGSLLPGKSADAVCIEFKDPGTHPVIDPLSQLVYAAGRENVSDVWIAGEHLLENRTLTRMDEKSVVQKAGRWAERMAVS